MATQRGMRIPFCLCLVSVPLANGASPSSPALRHARGSGAAAEASGHTLHVDANVTPPTAAFGAWPGNSAHIGEPLLKRQEHLHDWGQARYPDSSPLAEWEDLQWQGLLGSTCEAGNRDQCGTDLVCRQGICRRCQKSSECSSMHECVSAKFGAGSCMPIQQKAWERAFTQPYEALCTVMIFFASALAAAAGTGGGGMFVPLLVSLSGLKTDNAVPCSQFMIFLGSIINLVVFSSQRHPTLKSQPVIDYDCVVLLEPLLCLGVMFGVMANQVTPQWMLLLLLCLTMGLALWRTVAKGLQQYKEEVAMPPSSPDAADHNSSPGHSSGDMPNKQTVRTCFDGLIPKGFVRLTNMKAWQVILTVVVWASMLISSFHGLSPCSWKFLGFLGQISAVLFFLTYVAARRMQRMIEEDPNTNKGPVDWTANGILNYPMVAFIAGFLGGLLGLGGGIVMGPVLIEVGMHSEAVQATTAVFVFLSSSLATIQFARLGQTVWDYAIWYGMVTVFATMLGQWLCDVFVRKRGRYSMITLAIAGVLFASLASLLVIGVGQVFEDYYMGRQMWFSSGRLCNADGGGIVASDVVPADQWPSDLRRWERAGAHR